MTHFIRPTSPLAAGARTFVALAALTAVALAACTTGATPAARSGLPLEGTSWQLSSYVGPEGTEVPVPDGVAATARFEGGTVSGTGGCNSYTAAYTLDGEELTIDPVASTMMACEGPAGTLENLYFAALGLVGSYAIDDVTLRLNDTDGKTILTFEQATETALTGTKWIATGVNNGSEAVVSVLAGAELTAVFAEDGTVAGSGGCNAYNGPYATDGSSIDIGPLASTKKLCGEPAGVDDQEAQFLAALDNATTYAITGDTLELRDDSGALQVSFSSR
jgi:heat shock protein HslJ